MLIPAAAHLVVAGAVQGQVAGKPQGIEGPGVELIHLGFDVLQGQAAHTAHRIAEILGDYLRRDADGLENLGALVGLYGADAHLGGNLHDAVEDCVVIIIHRRVIILVQQPVVYQLPDGLLSQVGIDSTGTIS